ncbi:MAG: hypothetical protein ACK4Y4_09120 [Brevundimonas sp.]
MIALLSAVALAMVLFGQPELQADAQPATPEVVGEQTRTEEDRRNERVCERREVTGSGISRRVCTTRGEMEARAAADRRRLESMQGALTLARPDGYVAPPGPQ